ncbi:MAG TPA: hypothetical protein VIL16_03600 [Trebonia sp.]|jgi:hypothetical protein
MALLPAEFAELEAFADWILPTERERYAKRLASTMDEMQAFYDAAFPLLDGANKYLERFGMDGLPDPERNLLLLMMSLVLVSFPVEVWSQPRVPDSGAAYLDLVVEPRV